MLLRTKTARFSAITTESLIKSFGWDRKDAFVQQDAQEFSCFFFDAICEKLKKFPALSQKYSALIQGVLLNYIKCRNVQYRSERPETFFDVQLNVRGYSSLEESLRYFFEEERLEGDN